jgi:L-malate glycosyltransferase
LKILQLIQAKQYRGAEIFCCQLSNHLLDLGHEVVIVSIYEGSAILPFKKSVNSLNRPKGNRYFDLTGWKKLSDLIIEFNPDVIQANAADTLKYAVFSKLVFKWSIPLIYRNASASSFYIQNIFSRRFNAMLLKKVDLIISVSEASKKDLNGLFPFTEPKSLVIPVGVEQQKIDSVEIFSNKKFNIIHAGSFTREKNHFGLINIFKNLARENSDLLLHLIGDGDLREEIEYKIKEENLQDSIILHGGVKEPLAYIKAADVLVLPSLIEGLPGVILEAMYCKTPVITYNVGGVSEIVMDNTGVLIDKDDENSFAEAIEKCIIKPDQIKIENAFDMVREHFLNRSIAKEFLKIYATTLLKS